MMRSDHEQRSAVRGDAPLGVVALGFGFMMASELMSIKGFNIPGMGDALSPEGLAYSAAVLLAFLAGSAVCAALSRARRRELFWDVPFAGGCVLFALGISFVLAIDNVPGIPANLGVGASGLIGLGNAFLVVLWGRVFRAMPLGAALGTAAASFALGITASVTPLLFLANRGQVYLWIAYQLIACAALGFGLMRTGAPRWLAAAAPRGDAVSSGPAADSVRQGSDCKASVLAASPAAEGAAEATTSASPLRSRKGHALSGLWMVLFGLALFCFMFGIYWGHNLSIVLYDSVVEVVVSWLAAGLLVAFAVRAGSESSFSSLARIAIPVACLLLLADPLLAFAESGSDFLSSVFLAASFVILAAVNWTAFSRAAAARPASGDILISCDVACCCVLFALGVSASSLLGWEVLRVVASLLVLAFLVAVVVAFGKGEGTTLGADAGAGANGDAEAASGADAGVQVADRAGGATSVLVRDLAATAGLSAREQEVLGYLVQGRGAKYISEALFISVSTVQTHRKHIYKKLGVASREELLDLVSRP